jgi:hypothetical protein
MLLLTLLTALFFTGDQQPEPMAMVLSVQGESKLRLLDLLRAGESVAVPARGGVRLVFLADGHTETLQAGATVKITREGGTPAETVKRETTRLPEGQLDGLRSLAASARSGVSRVRDLQSSPPPLSPIQGSTVLGDRPRFVWKAVPDVPEYEVRLFHGDPDRPGNLVWSERVREASVGFPKEKPALERGETYTWQVFSRGGDGVAGGKFAVATKEKARDFEPVQKLSESNEVSDKLLAAMLFEAGGVYDESHQVLQNLAQKLPGEPWVLLASARDLGRLGRTTEATDLEKTARTLAKEPR